MAHFHLTHSVIQECFSRLLVNPGCIFPGQDELTTSGSCSHSHMRGLEHQMQRAFPSPLSMSKLQSKFVSYDICHTRDDSKDKCTLENFHILMSLRKLSPLELSPIVFWTTRSFPLAPVRTELTVMSSAKPSTSSNSGWVTWKLSIKGNNWKL